MRKIGENLLKVVISYERSEEQACLVCRWGTSKGNLEDIRKDTDKWQSLVAFLDLYRAMH